MQKVTGAQKKYISVNTESLRNANACHFYPARGSFFLFSFMVLAFAVIKQRKIIRQIILHIQYISPPIPRITLKDSKESLQGFLYGVRMPAGISRMRVRQDAEGTA